MTADSVQPVEVSVQPPVDSTRQIAEVTSPSTTAPAPETTEAEPVFLNEGPISIHDNGADGSFDVELSPRTTPAVRDVVVSWALLNQSKFRSAAARIASDRAAAAEAAAAEAAAAAAAATVPGPPPGPGATPAPTQPPPPPPPTEPPHPVLFNATMLEATEAREGEVRVQIIQQLGTPDVHAWSIAFHPDADGNAVLSTGIIGRESLEPFDATVRGLVGEDATEWVDPPGTWTTNDLAFDGDGNLEVTLASVLTRSDGQAKVVVPRDVADPMLSPIGRALRDGDAAYPATVDCAAAACVALSYDDGPSQHTSQLMDYLDRANAAATFFMIGSSVEKHPEWAREVAERGYQIGNHTWTHPRLGNLDLIGQAAEIEPTQRAIQDATGLTPDMLRPPYGSYSDATRWQQLALMFWNVDTKDWSHRDPATTVSTALSEVQPGAVILMHDLHPAAVVATPLLIAELRARGYTMASLDEMFPVREPGSMMWSADRTEPPLPPTTVPPVATAPPDSAVTPTDDSNAPTDQPPPATPPPNGTGGG